MACSQSFTTSSWRSSGLISPRPKKPSTSSTFSSYLAMISSFVGGTTMSFFDTVSPESVAWRKPSSLNASSTIDTAVAP